MTDQQVALFDANVLYPAPLRDILMQLTVADMFRGRWTADIHKEWIEALLRSEPHRSREALERTRALMDQATRDAIVTGYQQLIPHLSLPDPNDRHVLAAAIVGRCDVIVTKNLQDFPEKTLSDFGIVAQHPDTFLSYHLEQHTSMFCAAVRKVRTRLKNPPLTVTQHLEILTAQGLKATVTNLRKFEDQL